MWRGVGWVRIEPVSVRHASPAVHGLDGLASQVCQRVGLEGLVKATEGGRRVRPGPPSEGPSAISVKVGRSKRSVAGSRFPARSRSGQEH